jgi:hypothetical protein
MVMDKPGEDERDEKGREEPTSDLEPNPPTNDPHPPPLGALYALAGASTALGLAQLGVALSQDCLKELLVLLGVLNLGIGLLGLRFLGQMRDRFATAGRRAKIA